MDVTVMIGIEVMHQGISTLLHAVMGINPLSTGEEHVPLKVLDVRVGYITPITLSPPSPQSEGTGDLELLRAVPF